MRARRVVVTGLGLVTPLACGVEESWSRLIAARSGAGKITSFEKKPEISKFMAEQVVPHMATAMGMKPFDPATKEGFGCGGCHTVNMK